MPFFVISLKAGGTGLNLTAASHVVHFDRWWNPAVENQATDRAFRIGQTQERARAQVRLPRHGRGADRRADRIQAPALARICSKAAAEMLLTEMQRRRAVEARRARPARGVRGVRMATRRSTTGSKPTCRPPRGGLRRARAAGEAREEGPQIVAGRRSRAARSPRTFWGKAWCDNLERYSDFANRLPRGRTYVRNGSVVDLQIAPGSVTALVSGSTLYDGEGDGRAGAARRTGRAICRDCAGAIDSLVELLQGRFSTGVMARLCEAKTGLFPSPKDITLHVQLSRLGVDVQARRGRALRHRRAPRRQPELLFTLRKVDQQELIAKAGSELSKTRKRPAGAKVLASDDLAGMFGIEMAPDATQTRRRRRDSVRNRRPRRGRKEPSGSATSRKPAKRRKVAPTLRASKPPRTPAKRRSMPARTKK